MKLSTKTILPILLISAMLILLNGCFGIPDDSPGYTLAALDDFDLKTNKSDHNINLALAEAKYDTILVPTGANHLWIKVSRECEDSTIIEYNYYDGPTCGAYWESEPGNKPVYPDPLDDHPGWLPITIASDDEWWPNNGNHPGISICQNGGNILKIKITNTISNEPKVYTVVINRGN